MNKPDFFTRVKNQKTNNINSESKRIKKIVETENIYRIIGKSSEDNSRAIVAKIERDNKFKVKQDGDKNIWDITRNPSYKNEWAFSVSTIVLSGIISLLVGILLNKYQSTEKVSELKQVELKLEMVSRRLDSSLYTKK